MDIDQSALCRRQPVEEGEQARDHLEEVGGNLISYLTSIKQRPRYGRVLDYRHSLLSATVLIASASSSSPLVTTRGALSLERSYWRPTEK